MVDLEGHLLSMDAPRGESLSLIQSSFCTVLYCTELEDFRRYGAVKVLQQLGRLKVYVGGGVPFPPGGVLSSCVYVCVYGICGEDRLPPYSGNKTRLS